MPLKSDALFEKINRRLTKVDPNKREITHIYKMRITSGGKTVKTWMLDLKNVKLYEGDDEAECTLICDDDVMMELAANKFTPKEAVEQGKLKIEGEYSYAVKLVPYIQSVQES